MNRFGFNMNPCDKQRGNPRQLFSLFMDLDETLVRTPHLDNALELFVDGGYRGNKTEIKKFQAALAQCKQGNQEPLETLATPRNISIVDYPGLDIPRVTMPRPGAHKFLAWAADAFDEVNVCTSGNTAFQTLVLQLNGLHQYFDNIYGRAEIHTACFEESLTVSGHIPVLVDDNDRPGTDGWNRKMMAIGAMTYEQLSKIQSLPYQDRGALYKEIGDNHCVGIKYFHGDRNDTELTKIQQKLQQIISL